MANATVVSLKGLKRRARSYYKIGERVTAEKYTCPECKGAKCNACDNMGFELLVKGKGIDGCDALVPAANIRLD